MTNIIDKIVTISILIPFSYAKNWIQTEEEILPESHKWTDSAELNCYSYKIYFTYFDRITFQVQVEKKQIPITVTKLNIVPTGVITYQHINYDWITGPENSNLQCGDYEEFFVDKYSWSLTIDEISLDYDHKIAKLSLEGQTLPRLHSDAFCKPTLKP